MAHQLARAQREDHPHLLYQVDEDDVRIWHFLIVNLPSPYEGGEFIFRLRAPDDFPQRPPELTFLTPNGVYEADGGKICISIGEFHSRDRAGKEGAYGWRSVLGMIGFAGEVVNGLIAPDTRGGGIRLRNDPPAMKARLAATSAAFNAETHPRLLEEFAASAANAGSRAARDRHMWSAAAAAGRLDFAAHDPDELATLLAAAFGPCWGLLEEGCGAAGLPPGARGEVAGAAEKAPRVFQAVGGRLREALAERDASARRALVLGVNLRLLVELEAPPEAAAAALDALIPALAEASGGSCREAVPAAVRALPAALFPRYHAELAAFLREDDIDRKAAQGWLLVETLLAVTSAAPTVPPPAASPA